MICLWRHLTQQAYRAIPTSQYLWHGLRLLAVDSTALNLPESLWQLFGSQRSGCGVGPAQSRVTVLYDLLTRMPLRVKTGHIHRHQDQHLLKKLLNALGPGILLIMDAGFYGFSPFAHLLKKQTHFLIPMVPRAKPKLIKKLGSSDGLYEIKHHRRRKPPFGNQRSLIVRIVILQRNGFPPRRLLTSLLDPEAFPAQEIAMLYHERWHIETFFREFKHALHAQSWHARTPHAFYIELVFFMLLSSLTRLVILQSGKNPRTTSFGKTLSLLKRLLALSAFLPLNQWENLYRQLLVRTATYEIDVRPNRCFDRNLSKRRQFSRQNVLEGQFKDAP